MTKLRILMLGNSFIFVNDLPSILSELTGAEVIHHTRGGARLAEQLNPATKMGGLTQAALENEKWDYVILQEMSNGPITARESFLKNTAALCEQIRENGATPILYATWAYQKGGRQLESFGMDYDEMYRQMYASYHEAADRTGALIADVGEKFYELSEIQDLYAEDGCHPNEAGTRLAAETIAKVIQEDQARKREEEERKNPDKQPEKEKKTIVDKFGMGIRTKSVGKDKFRVKVKVCTGPTFYRWIFGAGGKIKIEGPEGVRDEYREMLKKALDEAWFGKMR